MSGSDGYTGNYRTETGDVTINVDGATVSEAIVGGAKIRTNVANGHATSSVGNVTVNMNSGTVSGIVGGNLINTVGTSTGLVVEGSTKDITINVNGGTIDKVAKGSSSSSVSISNTNFDAAIIGGNVSSIYASSVDNDSHKHTRIGSTGAITINIAKGSSVNGSIIAGSVISGKNTGVDNSSAAKATVNVYGEVLGDVVLGGAVVNGDENAVAPTTGEATIYVGEGAVIETIVAGDRKQDGATETSVANDSAKSIVFSSQNVSVDAIDTVGDKEGKNVKIVGTDTFNDSFASAEDAVAWMQSINGMEDGQAFTLQEGLVNDAVVVTPEGVQYKKNALMQDALDLAVAAPAQITRILTNDVRKRLGDLRSAQGVYGVWARYDGGKMSDDSDFEVDFNTIQVGFDTQPTPDAVRYGVAFSYTKGDTDLGRGEADMDAYSLAVYGTKFFDNGMFFDVIGRLATVDSDLEVTSAIQGNLDNRVLSLSGEFGWRFDVTKHSMWNRRWKSPTPTLTVNPSRLATPRTSRIRPTASWVAWAWPPASSVRRTWATCTSVLRFCMNLRAMPKSMPTTASLPTLRPLTARTPGSNSVSVPTSTSTRTRMYTPMWNVPRVPNSTRIGVPRWACATASDRC